MAVTRTAKESLAQTKGEGSLGLEPYVGTLAYFSTQLTKL